MAFTVISIAPSLSSTDYKLALAAGPRFKETAVAYPKMLDQAGWKITHHRDLTVEYLQTARHMLREEEARAEALTSLLGAADFADMQRRRRNTVQALDRGLLRRELIAAHALG